MLATKSCKFAAVLTQTGNAVGFDFTSSNREFCNYGSTHKALFSKDHWASRMMGNYHVRF